MTTQEMIDLQEKYSFERLLTFVCGACGSVPQIAEVMRDGMGNGIRWSAECCGKKGAGVLSDRQRNLLTIGRPVQVQAIVGEGIA